VAEILDVPIGVEYTCHMRDSTNDVWEVLSTARSVRRYTDNPVDDETLNRCLEAATCRRQTLAYLA
jgi:hypothetical protein